MIRALKRMLLIAGAVFFMFAWVLFTGDRFAVNIGGTQRIITRESAPQAYQWAEVASVIAGAVFFASGIYFLRRKS
jgi:hypothetical protein